jgi:hypothetical protein
VNPLHTLGMAVFVVLAMTSGAHAAVLTYRTTLSGPAEDPPGSTLPWRAYATVEYDDVAQTFRVAFDWNDLVGTSTAANIHGPTPMPGSGVAGVITTTLFPPGTTGGTFDITLDATSAGSYDLAVLTAQGGTAAAESMLASILAAGTGYLNFASTKFPSVEVRGYLVPVPLPATMVPLLTGLIGLVGVRRARRRTPAA